MACLSDESDDDSHLPTITSSDTKKVSHKRKHRSNKLNDSDLESFNSFHYSENDTSKDKSVITKMR
jgi:hypothetical protein